MPSLKAILTAILIFAPAFSLPAFADTEVPQLPSHGRTLEDFAPPGWSILDYVELDFNQDGLTDYVAVTEADAPKTYDDLADEEDLWNPRILFAIANTGQGYVLNLQNEHAVRSSDEGGVWGDPWEPLTGDADSFTVNAYGGSNWR